MGIKLFKQLYPTISNINYHPHNSLANIMRTVPLNNSFRKALVDDKLKEWLDLVAKISNINLGEGLDTFITARSMYLPMLNQHVPLRHKIIWKLKIPLKIKIFFLYLQRGVILMQDNLVKKN